MTDTLIKFKDGESVLLRNTEPAVVTAQLNALVAKGERFIYIDAVNTGIGVASDDIASIIKVER